MRAKECERQRAGGGCSKSEGQLGGWAHINDEFNLYANKLAALSTQTQRRQGDGDDDVGPTIMSHTHIYTNRHTPMQWGMP